MPSRAFPTDPNRAATPDRRGRRLPIHVDAPLSLSMTSGHEGLPQRLPAGERRRLGAEGILRLYLRQRAGRMSSLLSGSPRGTNKRGERAGPSQLSLDLHRQSRATSQSAEPDDVGELVELSRTIFGVRNRPPTAKPIQPRWFPSA